MSQTADYDALFTSNGELRAALTALLSKLSSVQSASAVHQDALARLTAEAAARAEATATLEAATKALLAEKASLSSEIDSLRTALTAAQDGERRAVSKNDLVDAELERLRTQLNTSVRF